MNLNAPRMLFVSGVMQKEERNYSPFRSSQDPLVCVHSCTHAFGCLRVLVALQVPLVGRRGLVWRGLVLAHFLSYSTITVGSQHVWECFTAL